MRVADFIVNYLEKKGITSIFMLTGGQAMWLNDAVQRSKIIKPIFVHHEQAAGMAAEAYGRVKGTLGVAMVTAGPAAVNVLNGVVGAWVDSSPMLVISGQSALSNVEYMEKTGIRQLGLQGIYTKPIGTAYTKFFVTIDDPSKVAYYVERAFWEATNGRTGPVWLEVPLDVQGMTVPEKILTHFEKPTSVNTQEFLEKEVAYVLSLFKKSKRPLWYVGQGIHIAKAQELFDKVLHKVKAPVVTARLGIDLVATDDSLWAGRPGLYGDRHAHFAVQTADLIVSIGARLDPGAIGYDAKDWGRLATKVIVDIDEKELAKHTFDAHTISIGAFEFLTEFDRQATMTKFPQYQFWVSQICSWIKKYPTVLPEYKKQHPVNSYYFSQRLSDFAQKNATIIVDTSSPFHVVTQSWKIKKGQRFLTTGGISTMGYWPAAIGACLANSQKQTILITGDGCLQMNLQELATVKHNNLPIKLFVINNNGYLLIRHTQTTHFEGRLIGESPKTGLFIPDTIKIAKVYGIKAVRIRSVKELDKKLKEILMYNGPVVCDVISPQWQPIVPRVSSQKMPDGKMVSKPFEDLYPFLPAEELHKILSGVTQDITKEKSKTELTKDRSDWG